MVKEYEDQPIGELDALRAPSRSESQRRRARERILAAAEPLLRRRRRPVSSWEVLAAWARPGLIAASIVALILTAALQLGRGGVPALEPVALDDVLASGEAGRVPALLVAINEPDADAVMAVALLEANGNGHLLSDDLGERR